MEYKTSTISGVCSVVTDGSHYSPKSVDDGCYMVSVKDFTEYGFDFSGCRKISEQDYADLKKAGCVPEYGDILVGKDGARYFEDIIIYRQPEKPALLSSIAILRCNTNEILPEYLYYLLRTPSFKKDVKENYGSGSAIPRIILKDFKRMPVQYPALEMQKKVVSILEKIDSKIQTNSKINDNLQQQAQAIFMQRFIMDKIEGDEKPLYDFADYINGAAFKPSECGDHGLPIIKIVELKNGITDSTKYFDGFKGEKYLIQDKDILFSWSGNPDTSIDIFIWTHGKAILNQHTFNVKSNTGHRWFTFLMLKYFKPEFSRIASNKQTTGLGHVTATDLKRLTFVFNKDAIEAFEHEVSPFMETIYTNMMENQRLEQLRDNLLPKLMSGEIDVSDIQL